MTLARLCAILDAYGADAARWPADEREAALALLARSAEARLHVEAAARLDAALDAAPEAPASALLAARVLRAAPPRRKRRLGRLFTVAAPLAAAAALVLWLVRAPGLPPGTLSHDEIAALGVYDTPTDALLASLDADLDDEASALGCAPGELGCLDLDLPEPDDSSRRPTPERSRA